MTTKNNWANRTKEDLNNVGEETLIPISGNLEPIAKFYRFTAPKKDDGKSEQLAVNQIVYGTYEGNFASKQYPDNRTHKIRTVDGLLVGYPGTKRLNDDLAKVPEGAKVQITYIGMKVITTGDFKGKKAHNFLVSATKKLANADKA